MITNEEMLKIHVMELQIVASDVTITMDALNLKTLTMDLNGRFNQFVLTIRPVHDHADDERRFQHGN